VDNETTSKTNKKHAGYELSEARSIRVTKQCRKPYDTQIDCQNSMHSLHCIMIEQATSVCCTASTEHFTTIYTLLKI